jgi:hypothetical protein
MTAIRARSTARLPLTQLIPVFICLCAFVFLPIPQFASLAWAESTEGESPCEEEERENCEESLIVCSSARRRSNDRRHRHISRPRRTSSRLGQYAVSDARLRAIVGHQLVGGVCAPLLV